MGFDMQDEYEHCPKCNTLRTDGVVMRASGDMANDLRHIINYYSREGVSNTPDFVLAEFMTDSLEAFEIAVRKREELAGRQIVDERNDGS